MTILLSVRRELFKLLGVIPAALYVISAALCHSRVGGNPEKL
ncbi:hypothetical protein [Rickettsia endosymbiont of Aspidapion aeneum]